MRAALSSLFLSALPMGVFAKDDNGIPFEACAPLGAYYPPPTIDKNSEPFKKVIDKFTKSFDDLIENGGSPKYGPISINTTSFSVVIFGGGEHLRGDPVFFEYYYTSPEDQASNSNLTLNTRFPVGDVSMVFTVYAWLAKMGEQWESPITKYLPELAEVNTSFTAAWKDVTIGALAGHMSGLSRESGACTIGEPCDFKVSFISSAKDLARAGHSMLASDLISPAITRRWLHSDRDTSNLRNGVGKPWEVYRAGNAISPIVDALTKSGTIGKYASYFGLTTDWNAGFAILAHDSSVKDRKLDLNVHADIVSEILAYLQAIAAKELETRYAGYYEAKNAGAAFNTTVDGRGLEVQKLVVDKVDIKEKTAKTLGIKNKDLDFRIYPTNIRDEHRHQFIAVFQDRTALIDAGTPTCISWQEIGAEVDISVVFALNDGKVVGVDIPALDVKMERAD
ncbi:hypothetical protein F53441_11708 [Fusarium austroafricanum]|uniref:Beta-lactamase-related domain-containing protein n=1 Tax=Fusarium austroafricanum TaxID=2364996 RepID=A0A8H4NYT6_9HYPO|nr:hypothetical protein F53441_11708 [Fusarium austroafricanum]